MKFCVWLCKRNWNFCKKCITLKVNQNLFCCLILVWDVNLKNIFNVQKRILNERWTTKFPSVTLRSEGRILWKQSEIDPWPVGKSVFEVSSSKSLWITALVINLTSLVVLSTPLHIYKKNWTASKIIHINIFFVIFTLFLELI